jgi:hypothetical protein
MCVQEFGRARSTIVCVCVLERRECGWESAKMPSSEGLIHFALFSALFHLLDGHTSLAPHPPEKKGPSVPASFVMGVWALLKLLAFHLSHSFCLSAKAFSTLFTRWYGIQLGRARLSVRAKTLSHKQASLGTHFAETALCRPRDAPSSPALCGQPLKGAICPVNPRQKQSPAATRAMKPEDA